MEFLTTKMKVLLGSILAILVCLTIYWIYMRIKKSSIGHQGITFSVPADKIYKTTLANGMDVLIFKNESLPKVLVQIAYDVGSYVEDSGERGLAHLIEHMIFKGTNKLSETDIDAIARKYGAKFNAFTSLDVTSYYFEANKNNWKPFIAILADCMQNARFDAQHLASEIKTVIQELKMGKDNYWQTMMLKACELSFPPHHPYHTPTIGFKEDLLSLNVENLKHFYKKYYRPDRAVLFIVGDVDVNEALALARKQFEHITAQDAPVNKNFPALVPELMTNHTRFFQDISTEQLGLYWVIPGMKSEHELIASVLDTLLGEGQSGRLHRLLVDEQKVATSVAAKAYKFMQAGVFLILIEPLAGKTDECVKLVQQEIAHILQSGFATEEIERIAKLKSRKFFGTMQDFTEFVYSWIQSYFATRNELYIFQRINGYYQVGNKQIHDFVEHFLDPFLMNRIEVVPLPESKRALKETIKRFSDELDKKILAQHVRTMPVEEARVANDYPTPETLTFTFPKPEKIVELNNGIKILLLPNHHVPLISYNCQFKEASFLDDAKEGIVLDFMMNMLMEGSKGYSKKENVDFFEQNGAAYSFDHQGAHFTCLKQDFEKLMQRFDHILRYPTFAEEAIDKLKKVFIDSYQRAKDSPFSMATRIVRNTVYKHHPFVWTYDDAIELIENLNRTTLKKLHAEFIQSRMVTISVVGDFQTDAVIPVIEQLCVHWPMHTPKAFVHSASPVISKSVIVDHYMLRDQMVLVLAQPSSVTIYNPDIIPLKMLNIINFRSLGSRIFRLREQTGLFYSAFGAFATNALRDHGYDFVGMLVSPENVVMAEESIKKLLSQIAQHGVVQDELEAARQMYLKDLIDLISDNGSIARLLCTLDSLGLGFDYYDKVLERIQKMDAKELNTIATKYYSVKDMSRVRVGPVSHV